MLRTSSYLEVRDICSRTVADALASVALGSSRPPRQSIAEWIEQYPRGFRSV